MLKRLLFSPDDAGSALSAPPAPSAVPNPTPIAPAPPVPAPEPSDDPFEAPKKPAAPAPKPAYNKGAPVAPDEDKLAPADLRKIAKQRKADLETAGGTIKSLESKIKEAEGRGADTSALTARLTAVEKERDTYQAELRAARQEASPEFKEKFDKPFNMAAERAKKQISELTVASEDGTQRPATWEDFAALYSLPTGKAIEQAAALFGAAAQFVLGQREKLLDLQQSRDTALAEEKAQYKERGARDIAEQAKNREGVSKLWVDTNKRLSQLEHYKVDPTDAELAEAAKHAESVFDATINAADKDDFVKQRVLKDAHVKQKTIGFAVRGIVINRLKEQNAALQKQVDDLKGTAPGGTQRPGGSKEPAPGDDSDWEASAQKAMKAAVD